MMTKASSLVTCHDVRPIQSSAAGCPLPAPALAPSSRVPSPSRKDARYAHPLHRLHRHVGRAWLHPRHRGDRHPTIRVGVRLGRRCVAPSCPAHLRWLEAGACADRARIGVVTCAAERADKFIWALGGYEGYPKVPNLAPTHRRFMSENAVCPALRSGASSRPPTHPPLRIARPLLSNTGQTVYYLCHRLTHCSASPLRFSSPTCPCCACALSPT
jgi:hypothetical protein